MDGLAKTDRQPVLPDAQFRRQKNRFLAFFEGSWHEEFFSGIILKSGVFPTIFGFLTNSEVNGRKIRKNWAKMAGQLTFVRLGKGYLRIRQNFFSLDELTDRQTDRHISVCLSVGPCVWGVVVKKSSAAR